MKRTILYLMAASFLLMGSAKQASACCYIPWLDPFAWLGFYGCGYNPWMGGCGNQCGYGGYGGGYGMQQPGYGYAAPSYTRYAPSYPPMNFQPATPSCNCQGAALPQPQLNAVQVPVTTYRPVTQYVPQTSYRTQYQYVRPQLAYQQAPANVAYQQAPAQFAYQQPQSTILYQQPQATAAIVQPQVPLTYGYPTTASTYGFAPATGYTVSPTIGQTQATGPIQTIPVAPGQYQPQIYQSQIGDIAGDHELGSQTATIPVIPNAYSGQIPVRRATLGVAPRTARSFSATVR